ncbi:MAG: hypothetical protein V7633_1080 [Pseudonocardia sp.]
MSVHTEDIVLPRPRRPEHLQCPLSCAINARFLGPKGQLQLRPADWHLFAALTAALGPTATTTVLAEIGYPADRLPPTVTHVESSDGRMWRCLPTLRFDTQSRAFMRGRREQSAVTS